MSSPTGTPATVAAAGPLPVAEADALVRRTLERVGTDASQAAAVARALVGAELAGQAGHGLRRLPSYAAQVRAGKIDGEAKPVLAHPRPGILSIDAAHGFAYPALELAVEALPPLAVSQGIAAAGIRRSHHAGVTGLVVEALAEREQIALLFANTPAAMAPYGGRTALFGTNPIAFGAPAGADGPLVIDLSMSAVARGRILAASQRGEAIPNDWAMDAQGRPTTDPMAALAGTMAPVGGPKGAALALMVEVLAAGLTGGRFAFEASSFLDDKGDPPATGQLLIAMDPSAFGPGGLDRIAALASAIGEEPGARVPGARRHQIRAQRMQEGLSVDPALLAEIEAISCA
ncbi:MAG: Ldh family oxidoreductase [Pseudomonadota bacterium]